MALEVGDTFVAHETYIGTCYGVVLPEGKALILRQSISVHRQGQWEASRTDIPASAQPIVGMAPPVPAEVLLVLAAVHIAVSIDPDHKQ